MKQETKRQIWHLVIEEHNKGEDGRLSAVSCDDMDCLHVLLFGKPDPRSGTRGGYDVKRTKGEKQTVAGIGHLRGGVKAAC